MSTLHDRIRAVVEERLRIAREAAESHARAFESLLPRPTIPLDRFLVANDPADAILGAEHALDVLDRHALKVAYGDQLVCAYCQQMCHSRSGLGCDDPDAPYPCDEIRALATRWRVEVDG